MTMVKLNGESKDFDVIPEVPKKEDVKSGGTSEGGGNKYIKSEEVEERKMFANKKANIALGIAGGVIAVLIIAAIIFVYVV